MKNKISNTIYINRYEVKKQGHESAFFVYGVKPNLDTDYENLIYTVSNICLLPLKEYTKLIKKSKRKKLAQKFYNSFDTIYQMLYQQTLTWYFNLIKMPDFNYKLQYEKFFKRISDEYSCPIIIQASGNYTLKENLLDVFSKTIKYATLNKVDNLDAVIYKNNLNIKNRERTELGELIFSKIINEVYFNALQFIRNNATCHILDSSDFFKKIENNSIDINPEYLSMGNFTFCGYFKLKNKSITVNLCYEILKEGGFILHRKNSYKTFKSLFKKGVKIIPEKIEWKEDIKALIYFIKLLHEGKDDEKITAPCENNSDYYTIANDFFSIENENIGIGRLRNNNRILKNKVHIETIKKAINSLNA